MKSHPRSSGIPIPIKQVSKTSLYIYIYTQYINQWQLSRVWLFDPTFLLRFADLERMISPNNTSSLDKWHLAQAESIPVRCLCPSRVSGSGTSTLCAEDVLHQSMICSWLKNQTLCNNTTGTDGPQGTPSSSDLLQAAEHSLDSIMIWFHYLSPSVNWPFRWWFRYAYIVNHQPPSPSTRRIMLRIQICIYTYIHVMNLYTHKKHVHVL